MSILTYEVSTAPTVDATEAFISNENRFISIGNIDSTVESTEADISNENLFEAIANALVDSAAEAVLVHYTFEATANTTVTATEASVSASISRRINYSDDGTLVWKTTDNALTRVQLSLGDKDNIDDSIAYEPDAWISDDSNIIPHYYFDFGSSAIIYQIGISFNYSGTIELEVSDNTTDGLDGTWTQTMAPIAYTGSTTDIQYLIAENAIAGKWARVKLEGSAPSTSYLYKLHLFGSYTAPQFKLFDGAGTSEITLENPLQFPDAHSNVPYDEDLSFTVKNVDSATHSYSIQVEGAKAVGDTFVTTYFTAVPTTIVDLTAGAVSTPIIINGTFTGAQNPTDGKHYIKVIVLETV